MNRVLAVLAVFLALPLSAQRFECGTTDERTARELRRADTLRERAAQRGRIRGEAEAAPVVEARDGVFVVKANDENAPFNNQFDLTGRTLRWTPTGHGTWTVANIPIEWDTTPSSQTIFNPDRYTLPFAFPFGGGELKQVWIGRTATLSSGTQPARGFGLTRSLTAHELAGARTPLISALGLQPQSNIPADIRIAGKDGASIVTWQHTMYEVQIKLRPDGSMDFNYRRAADNIFGGIAVITGSERWRDNAVVSEATDEANPAGAGYLDAEKIKMTRYPDAGLIELRATMRTGFTPQTLPESGIIYDFEFADQHGVEDVAVVFRRNNNNETYAPVWGWVPTEYDVVVDGRDIVLWIDQNLLRIEGDHVPLKLYVATLGQQTPNDVVSTEVSLGTADHPLSTNFSSITTPVEIGGAPVESFTLPPLSLPVIWEQMKAEHKLRDTDVDAIAVFQDFTTDIVFSATAYALGGNPGVANIHSSRSAMGPQFPLTPSLLHMNRLSIYTSDRTATHLLLHEFGHRWLQSLVLKEGATTSRVLNPSTNHPAQYVHMPAAFPVFGSREETSVMGGGNFNVTPNGIFTSIGEQGYGYSWIDLYLMGLAQPAEVAPFFYIANSSPALGSAYNPPAGTWTGTKRDVTIEQILEPMGQRNPAYPATQRTFRVLFVLVTDGTASNAEVAKLHELRSTMTKNFKIATGGRADLTTDWFTGGPRRRAVRR
jgi:hypothetical protein